MYSLTPDDARAVANNASEAIRALNYATPPADGCPALRYPSDAYYLLGAPQQLAGRLPQLLEQISAFLQRQLQPDAITIIYGEFAGDPLAAIGTASDELQNGGSHAARVLADALDTPNRRSHLPVALTHKTIPSSDTRPPQSIRLADAGEANALSA